MTPQDLACAPGPRKYYKLDGASLVETTKNDPERILCKGEVDQKGLQSLFLGLGIGIVVQQVLKRFAR